MRYLLNKREMDGLEHASKVYEARFGKPWTNDADLFIHLGDNPAKYLCWSATSNRVPTFRTGSGFIYNPCREQWLLPKDKLACLGFPVEQQVATAMGVAQIPVADRFRASSIAGNSFHFSTVAVVQMVALACYRLKSNDNDWERPLMKMLAAWFHCRIAEGSLCDVRALFFCSSQTESSRGQVTRFLTDW